MFKVLLNLLTDVKKIHSSIRNPVVFSILKVQYHVVGFGTKLCGTTGSSLVLFDDDNLMMMMMIMMMTMFITRI